METLATFLIVAGAIGALIYVIARPNRYSKMTEQEFEEDAKKGSLLGAAVIGLERSLRPRETDYLIEEKLRIDKDATPTAGEPPEDSLPAQQKPHLRLHRAAASGSRVALRIQASNAGILPRSARDHATH